MLETPPAQGDPIVEWDLVLRAYAAVVDEHRAMLMSLRPGAEGTVVEHTVLPPRFTAPAGLGQLPVELLPRARALAAETAGLVTVAVELSDELAAASASMAPHPAGTRPSATRTLATAASGFTMDQRM